MKIRKLAKISHRVRLVLRQVHAAKTPMTYNFPPRSVRTMLRYGLVQINRSGALRLTEKGAYNLRSKPLVLSEAA